MSFLYKKHFKKTLVILMISVFIFNLAGCKTTGDSPVSLTHFCFNTVIKITIYEYAGESDEKDIINECFGLCNHFEKLFSKTIDESDISCINQSKGKPCQVNHVVSDIINDSLEYSKLSDGAFDISIGALTKLWNMNSDSPSVPSEKEIKNTLKHVNYKNIRCDDEEVYLLDKNMKLDLGSIVKGFVADKLKSYMTAEGVSSAIIDLGGNILTIGNKPDGTDFIIGIKNPFYNNKDIQPKNSLKTINYNANNDEYCAKLAIRDKSVVTSGIYERYFKENGKIYHHILDTKTGYPIENELVSVTILSASSEDGDALSTTAFALGLDKGISLINKTDKTEAIFITRDGQLHLTNGLEISENKNIQLETTTKQ